MHESGRETTFRCLHKDIPCTDLESKSADLLQNNVTKYSESTELNKYGARFKYSKFLKVIDDSHESITSNITTVQMRRDLRVTLSALVEYSIGFGNAFGLGDGNIFHISFSTDTDDLFSDNSYTGSFSKSYGTAIFEVGVNYNIYVTGALNSGDSTYIFFSVGTVF